MLDWMKSRLWTMIDRSSKKPVGSIVPKPEPKMTRRAEPAPPAVRDGLTGDEMRDMAEREYPLLHDDHERLARMVATDIKRSLRDERRQAGEGGGQAPDKGSRH